MSRAVAALNAPGINRHCLRSAPRSRAALVARASVALASSSPAGLLPFIGPVEFPTLIGRAAIGNASSSLLAHNAAFQPGQSPGERLLGKAVSSDVGVVLETVKASGDAQP